MSKARDIASHGYSSTNANILINPSFTVQQRGDVIDHTTIGYGPDRWVIAGLSYVGGTLSRSSTVLDATTGVSKLKVEHSGATNNSSVQQRIEAVNLQGLYGSEITFSFGYSDSGSGDPLVEIRSYDSGSTSKTLFDAVPTDLGGGRWSCTVTLSTDDGTFPDPSDLGLVVQIDPNEKNTAPNQWYVWETKLEAGSEATPFVARPYSEELSLCQRYYYQIGDGTGFGSAQSGGGANAYLWAYPFRNPVTMRADPTLSLISGGSTYFVGGIGVTIGTPTGDLGTVNTSSMNIRSSSTTTVAVHRLGLDGFTFNRGQGYGGTSGFVHCDAEL